MPQICSPCLTVAIIAFSLVCVVGIYYLILKIRQQLKFNKCLQILCDRNTPVRISPNGIECDYSKPCADCKHILICLQIPNSFPAQIPNWKVKENVNGRS